MRACWTVTVMTALVALICRSTLSVQDNSLKQQVTAIRETAETNKLALFEYTWEEQETMSVNDKVQEQKLFQVEFSRDGKLERTPLGLPEANLSASKENRGMGEWLSQKKKHALQAHSQEVKELVQAYTEADTDLLRLAYERGDVSSEPSRPGISGARLVIHHYVKPGDSLTLVFDPSNSELQSLEATSYLTSTKDPVVITALFSKLDHGPNHIDQIIAVATKKHLSLSIRNLAYQRASSSVLRDSLAS